MSRTDKDRPYWVRIQDAQIIEHDHRDGVCIIGDDRRERWSSHRHHYRVCPRSVTESYTCTKREPNRIGRYWTRWAGSRRAQRSDYRGQTCWTSVLDCDEDHTHSISCPHERVQCIGHTRTYRDYSTPCEVCDRPRATCYPCESVEERYSMFGGGGVPGWYVRAVWHGPERARERIELRDAALRYNSGDELDGYDFENRQARGSARWTWH